MLGKRLGALLPVAAEFGRRLRIAEIIDEAVPGPAGGDLDAGTIAIRRSVVFGNREGSFRRFRARIKALTCNVVERAKKWANDRTL